MTAYYTKEKDSRLHHFETEGQKYELTPAQDGRADCSGKKRQQPEYEREAEARGQRNIEGASARRRTRPTPSDKAAGRKPMPKTSGRHAIGDPAKTPPAAERYGAKHDQAADCQRRNRHKAEPLTRKGELRSSGRRIIASVRARARRRRERPVGRRGRRESPE